MMAPDFTRVGFYISREDGGKFLNFLNFHPGSFDVAQTPFFLTTPHVIWRYVRNPYSVEASVEWEAWHSIC